jgi:uncharacterized protein YegP (UPF0339 family)
MRTVVIYQDDQEEYRWHLVAENGEIIADSGEGYKNKDHCVEMARSVNHVDDDVDYVDMTEEQDD